MEGVATIKGMTHCCSSSSIDSRGHDDRVYLRLRLTLSGLTGHKADYQFSYEE